MPLSPSNEHDDTAIYSLVYLFIDLPIYLSHFTSFVPLNSSIVECRRVLSLRPTGTERADTHPPWKEVRTWPVPYLQFVRTVIFFPNVSDSF